MGWHRANGRVSGRRSLRELEQALGHREPVRTRVVLRPEIAKGQIKLRREHENRESGLEPDPAVGEAHADGDGDERDPERRRELEDGPREERDAEVIMVVLRYCSLVRRSPRSERVRD